MGGARQGFWRDLERWGQTVVRPDGEQCIGTAEGGLVEPLSRHVADRPSVLVCYDLSVVLSAPLGLAPAAWRIQADEVDGVGADASRGRKIVSGEQGPVAGFRRSMGTMPGDALCSASKQGALYHIVMYV